MVKRPTKYRARTAPIQTQPDMFGGPPKPKMVDRWPCEVFSCSAHGSFGFGLSGPRMGVAMTKYYCDTHRAHGEAYYRQINGG